MSIASLRSSPITVPPGRTRSAAVRATIPVPHATSSMRSPERTPIASSNRGAHSANRAGTNVASYTSAASIGIWKRSCVVIGRR